MCRDTFFRSICPAPTLQTLGEGMADHPALSNLANVRGREALQPATSLSAILSSKSGPRDEQLPAFVWYFRSRMYVYGRYQSSRTLRTKVWESTREEKKKVSVDDEKSKNMCDGGTRAVTTSSAPYLLFRLSYWFCDVKAQDETESMTSRKTRMIHPPPSSIPVACTASSLCADISSKIKIKSTLRDETETDLILTHSTPAHVSVLP